MIATLRTIGLKLRSIEALDGWVVGVLADDEAPPSRRVSWIKGKNAVRYQIQNHTIATATAPFFVTLASEKGFFRSINREALLREFLQVEYADAGGLALVLRRYGVFAEGNLYLPDDAPQKVGDWWRATAASGQTPMALSAHEFWNTQAEVAIVGDLSRALSESDAAALPRLLRALGPSLIKDYEKQERDASGDARFVLSATVARHLGSARVAPIEENGKLIPCVATTFVRDAIYMQLMERITEGNPLRLCLSSRCTTVFAPSRPDQHYCCTKCQNLVKRYRQLGTSLERTSTMLYDPKRKRTARLKR